MVATLLLIITKEMDFQPLIKLMVQIAPAPQDSEGHGGKILIIKLTPKDPQ